MSPFDLDDLKAFTKKAGLPAAMLIAALWGVTELGPDAEAWRCQVPQRTQSQILELLANGGMSSDEAIRMAETFRDHGFLCRPDDRQHARLSDEIRGRQE